MKSITEQAAALFGLQLTSEQVAAFEIYAAELAEWNAKFNLTTITEPQAVQVRHFLDSLSIVQALPLQDRMRLIDVGTGAGFPGMALAIVFPEIDVTLLESTGKKVVFLDHVIDTLQLSNVHTLKARAEDAGQDRKHRAKYDLVLARAVARLPVLLEYMLPLARVGGHCIAMKGQAAQDEVQQSANALKTLGGKVLTIESVQLPTVEDTHYLVIIEKNSPTHREFPRRAGDPQREPLQ